MSHESFHLENLDVVRKFLFFNHYPQIEQVKSRQSSDVDTDTQSEIFDAHNTIVLPYFGQISKIIQFMLKKFKIHTIFRIPFKMEGLITFGKDVLNRFEKSGVVYKLICKKCKVTYVTLTGVMLRFCTRKIIREKENLWRCYI